MAVCPTNTLTLAVLHHYLPEVVDGEVRFPVAVIFTKIPPHHMPPLLYCISDSVSPHHDELHTVILWDLSNKVQCSLDYLTSLGPRHVQIIKKFG